MLNWLIRGRRQKTRAETQEADTPVKGDDAVSERSSQHQATSSERQSQEVSIRPGVEVYREPSVNEALFPKARRIARSLQEAPDDWEQSADRLTIYHRDSGYTIWIANEDYKMGERIKIKRGPEKTIPYSKAEAMIIWPAVASALRHIGEREASDFFDKPVKARLRQRTSDDVWVCQDIGAKKTWVGIGQTPDEAYRVWLGANYLRYRDEAMQGRPMVAWRG